MIRMLLFIRFSLFVIVLSTSWAATRWFKLLQDNMSPVQLVDLSYMNKHELPMPPPPPNFSTPVLVMVGDEDVVVDVEAARETAQHLGQSEAIELQGVAHDLMLVSICSGIQTHCCGKSLLLLTLFRHHSMATVILGGIVKQLNEATFCAMTTLEDSVRYTCGCAGHSMDNSC